MANSPEKARSRDSEKASIVNKVAKTLGVSKRYVYQVINGDRDNEEVISAYMFLREGENRLLEAVKNLVPFN